MLQRTTVEELEARWSGSRETSTRCVCRCGRRFDVFAALDAHQLDHEARGSVSG